MYAAAGFILTFFNILLYNFIDVEFAQMAKDVIIEKTYEMMEGFGASEFMVDEAISEIEKQDSFSVESLAKGYVFGLPVYIILSLIIAAFIKRNKPEFEAKMDISVVVPSFNEAESLPELCAWIDKVMQTHSFTYEVIVVDDGSVDNTWSR